MSELTDKGHEKRSLRHARDLLEHPGEVLTKPWWDAPELDQGESSMPMFVSSAERRRAERGRALHKEIDDARR